MGATVAATALPALAGLFGGLGQGQLSQTAQQEQYVLNKRQLADSEAELADQLTQQSQLNPLRDQAIYNMSNLLGASPAAFNPTNYAAPTNTGAQGSGGVNLNAVANANAAYTPGAGGVTGNTQQMILNRLGYGNVGTGTMYDSSTTPPDTLTSLPTAASTTGATAIGGQGVTGGNANTTNTATTPIAGAGTPTPAQLSQENNSVPPWAQNQLGLGSSASTAAMAPASTAAAAPVSSMAAPTTASVNGALLAKLAPQTSAATGTSGLSAAQLAQQKLLAQQMGLMGSLNTA